MDPNQKLNSMGQPVPELPVADVERAQQHYRDALGFTIGWLYPGKEIGAVSRDKAVIFFRRASPHSSPPFTGSSPKMSTPGIGNCNRPAQTSWILWRKNPGAYVSSPSAISTETFSISTMTNQTRNNQWEPAP